MVTKQVQSFRVNADTSNRFATNIIKEGIYAKEFEFEYNLNGSKLATRIIGVQNIALTDSFKASIEKQLHSLLEEVIMPLVNAFKCNFTLVIQVDPTGKFLRDDLKITLRMDCFKKIHSSVHEIFRAPFKTLQPLSELIDYIFIRGREYKVAVVEAELNVSACTLLDVIRHPIVGEASKAQWFAFAIEANAAAKKEYQLDVRIPIKEGEVTWDVPYSRKIQYFEILGKE